jgi:hypothetical protein
MTNLDGIFGYRGYLGLWRLCYELRLELKRIWGRFMVWASSQQDLGFDLGKVV